MDTYTPLWLGLAFAGVVAGLWVNPSVLTRIAVALFMLSGLGVVMCNTAGWRGPAYWFGVAMAAIVLMGVVAMVGAFAGWCIRRLVNGPPQQHHPREYNGVIQ